MATELLLSLDTEQTTGRPTPTEDFQEFSRHSIDSEWTSTHQLYLTLADLDSDRELQRFEDCRKKAWFVQNCETLEVRVASSKCNLRWCPLCANSRQMFITAQVTDWLKCCHHPKLLTLTLKHTSAPLLSHIQFLYDSFRQLRKRSYFKKNVTGGVWFFQVKKAKSDSLWHPHIHCVIDGNFLKHAEIKRAWAQITRTSDIVHIKPCTNVERSAKHIARYAARPSDLESLEFPEVLELYYAMKSRRLVGSWGTARSLSFRPTKPDDAELWQNVGSWYMVTGMRHDSEDAAMLYKSWITNKPAPRKCSMTPLENAMRGADDVAASAPPLQQYLDFYKIYPP